MHIFRDPQNHKKYIVKYVTKSTVHIINWSTVDKPIAVNSMYKICSFLMIKTHFVSKCKVNMSH